MKESSGEAARMAQIIGDTLQGSFLKFTSAIQGLSIGIMKDFVVDHSLNTLNHLISIYDNDEFAIYPEIELGLNTDNIEFYSPIDNSVNYRFVIMGF